MTKFHYSLDKKGKLVRDQIADQMRAQGHTVQSRQVSGDELLQEILEKFPEEFQELQDAFQNKDEEEEKTELADLQTLIDAFIKARGYDMAEINRIKNAKAKKKGAFDDGVFIEWVDLNPDVEDYDFWCEYHRNRPYLEERNNMINRKKILDNENDNQKLLDILSNAIFMTLSTVSIDGSPYATPISRFAFDGENIAFDNKSESVHGANLRRDNRCFITLVCRNEKYSRALYIRAFATELTGEKLEKAKEIILNSGRTKKAPDEIFAVSLGQVDHEKSVIETISGREGFYIYLKSKEEK